MTPPPLDRVVTADVPPIVEACLNSVRHIATLPVVALKIAHFVEDHNSSAEDVSKIIASDPPLSLRILKVVNSSFYCRPQKIVSIDRAVLVLGFNVVKNIAIAASLHKLFRANSIDPRFDARDFWLHSVAVATGARALATAMGLVLNEESFLAGLIHDVGIMIEMQARRLKFVQVINALSAEQSLTFRQAEVRLLGATHEDFGAGLCRKWQFPKTLEYVTGFHHRPMELPESERVQPAIVHVADILAARIGLGYSRTVETNTVDQQVLEILGLSENDLEAVVAALPSATQEAQQILSD